VLEKGLADMKGLMESGRICAARHFPGEGIDERDQHLSSSVDSLSCGEWDATFGMVYKGLIDAGVHSFVAGHMVTWTTGSHGYSFRVPAITPSSRRIGVEMGRWKPRERSLGGLTSRPVPVMLLPQ
jgi:hypothetical protein